MRLHTFTFNPFQENTYILYNDKKEAIVLDPGCYYGHERQTLSRFIEQRGLSPIALVNTHCHLDHVFGNRYISQTYQLELHAHRGEQVVLDNFISTCKMYGIPNVEASPNISQFLEGGSVWEIGDFKFNILFTPGHSPASICLYEAQSGILLGGDVLFQNSIGRTDLPGGNYETLMHSIHSQILTLPDDTQVFSGHGPSTTVGRERRSNPFLQQ